MNDKFTIRDFVVFFMSGFVCICTFLIINYPALYQEIDKLRESEKGNIIALISLLIIPFIYFIGQVVHAIDTLFLSIGIYLDKKKPKNTIVKLFYFLIFKHRIRGCLKINVEDFWEKSDYLYILGLNNKYEYLYVLNDFYKGLSLIFTLGFFNALFVLKISWALLFIFLSFVFWYKAMFYSKNYVKSVLRGSKIAEKHRLHLP